MLSRRYLPVIYSSNFMILVDRFLNEGPAFRIFAVFGFIAPLITFLIALAEISAVLKIVLLTVTAVVYVILFVLFSRNPKQEVENNEHTSLIGSDAFRSDQFAALDEANQFFGASMKQAEMFRLVAARVNEIFPFAAAAFFVPDAGNDSLDVVETLGDMPEELLRRSQNVETGLAGMAYISGEIELDRATEANSERPFATDLGDFASAAAIPMVYDGRVLAVLELFTMNAITDIESAIETLYGLQTRITPLFLGSFAFERSLTSAFTDALTALPNARALYMVLENQLAESARFRGDRPLTVLAIDVKNFRSINEQFGHSTGDKVLIEITERIRGHLRKMDFLARTDSDEFLIVLPLAGEHSTAEVISRIDRDVSSRGIQFGELDIRIGLNFGAATYWEDGETPQQLTQNAQLRKQQAKAEEAGNVVLFPKEYVN